jgi:hypothetical protein
VTPDDVVQATTLLVGEWPSPPMADPEAAVWAGHMAGWTSDEFLRAVTALIRSEPRRFRPTPSEVLHVVSAGRRRDRNLNVLNELPSADQACPRSESLAALERILSRTKRTPT